MPGALTRTWFATASPAILPSYVSLERRAVTKYLAFDLEIAKIIPEDAKDWEPFRPLGISCAATLRSDDQLRLWHGRAEYLAPFSKVPSWRFATRMEPGECRALAAYLLEMQAEGFTLLTYNGLGFDLKILAEECRSSPWREKLKALALDHLDIAFAFFCEKGFMISLDVAAKGMGLAGKLEGMKGALAPRLWRQSLVDQERVLDYVAQDVRTTARLYETILARGYLRWTSRKGNANYWWPQDREIKLVSQALSIPEPDTSWMLNSWKREKFHGWTGRRATGEGEAIKEKKNEGKDIRQKSTPRTKNLRLQPKP